MARSTSDPPPVPRAVGWFYAVACLVSWAWLGLVALGGERVRPGVGWPTHFPALLGPLLAAALVGARFGGSQQLRRWGRDLVRVRVAPRWWLFALSPVLLAAAALLVGRLPGQDGPRLSDFAVMNGLPSGWAAALVWLTILLVNGFGEEAGWRGYALPQLQRRYPPLTATLLLTALWAGWHLPMFVVVQSFRTMQPAMLVGWLFGLSCGAVVLTWLYNHSGGSIALVAIWHAGYNLVSATDAAQGLLVMASTTLVIALAITLVALEVRARRQGRPSVLGGVTLRALPPSRAGDTPAGRGRAQSGLGGRTGT